MAIEKVGSIRADGLNRVEPDEFRRIVRSAAPEGILTSGGFAITQNGTPNMSVNVAAGEALVEGDEATDQGTYYVRNDGTINVAVSAANSTNPRKDIVILEVKDSEYSGSTDAAQIRVVAGTPASSPVVPATPNSSLKLAELTIAANATTVVTANINSTRSRIRNAEHQFLVNDAPTSGNGIIGASVTVFSGTITKPATWQEYDVHVHGFIEYEAQLAAGVQVRFTQSMQSPSGTERTSCRGSLMGEATGVSVVETLPVDTAVTGLSADLTYRIQTSITRGAGCNYTQRYLVATLTRLR